MESSLRARLFLALAVMLVPVALVGGAGTLMLQGSARSLERTRDPHGALDRPAGTENEPAGIPAAAEHRRDRYLLLLAFVLLGSLALASLVAGRLDASIVGRLRRLRRAAERLRDGDLAARAEVKGDDELAEVARSFNAMAERLSWGAERRAGQAFRDPLTGLPSRELFADRLRQALGRAGRASEPVAVLVVGLDELSSVDDSLGREHGDELLTLCARRLEGCLRPGDTGARLGGGEFGVLLENPRQGDAPERVALRIVEALSAPYDLRERRLALSARVGICVELVDAAGQDELLRNARRALDSAKAAGGTRIERFQAGVHADALERVELEADLRGAVAKGQLVLHYQPVVDLRSGRVVGVEALVRWLHPERGIVPPLSFIPAAERSGLIVPIGRWVLGRACLDVADLRARDAVTGRLRVSVNLSPRQFQHAGLVRDVDRALRAAGLPADALLLELTECALLAEDPSLLATLHELKALGVRLALDDFGTGHTAPGSLQQYPLDELKIDKTLIDGFCSGGDEEQSLRAGELVRIGQVLRLRTVAKGIESSEQALELHRIGCDHGQGYLFARPLPLEELVGYLERANLPFFLREDAGRGAASPFRPW